MTAQILKNDTMMHTTPRDPEFMIRWLRGTLSEEELSTLRNRDEYEEMMSSKRSSKKVKNLGRHDPPNVQQIVLRPWETLVIEDTKTNAFPTFVAIAMAALLAILFISKLLIGTL